MLQTLGICSMETDHPSGPAKSGLSIGDTSQLVTLAQINPQACARYAQQLVDDLNRSLASCRLGDSGLSLEQRYEQIHSLKNLVIPTGSPPLLDACAGLQRRAMGGAHDPTLRSTFEQIAKQARDLVEAFRGELLRGSAPTS